AIVRRSRTGLARASFTAVIYDGSSTRVRPFPAIVRRSRTGLARASFTAMIYDASSTRVRSFAAIVRSQHALRSNESAAPALSQKRPRRPGSRLKGYLRKRVIIQCSEKDSGRLVPPGQFFARASFTAVIYDASSTRVRPLAAIVRRSRTGLARASFTAVIHDASSTRVRPFPAIVRSQRTSLSGESAVTALSQKRPRRPGSRLKRPFDNLYSATRNVTQAAVGSV
ncbi:MAG: hypothetical protein P4L33_19840, partial [Capsulimonadaceae bacterium]|nr:hypothetical protein [Capsulimonadaceae bacterium]